MGVSASEPSETVAKFFTPPTILVDASVHPDDIDDTLPIDDAAAKSASHDTSA